MTVWFSLRGGRTGSRKRILVRRQLAKSKTPGLGRRLRRFRAATLQARADAGNPIELFAHYPSSFWPATKGGADTKAPPIAAPAASWSRTPGAGACESAQDGSMRRSPRRFWPRSPPPARRPRSGSGGCKLEYAKYHAERAERRLSPGRARAPTRRPACSATGSKHSQRPTPGLGILTRRAGLARWAPSRNSLATRARSVLTPAASICAIEHRSTPLQRSLDPPSRVPSPLEHIDPVELVPQ